MQQRFTIEELAAMKGGDLYSQEGDKVGIIDRVFYDTDSGRAEWIGVDNGGLFGIGSKTVLVPVEGAVGDERAGGLQVPYPRDLLKDAPTVDGDEISESYERDVYEYYGLPFTDHRPEVPAADEPLPEGQGTAPMAGDTPGTPGDTVSRHEEEFRVGKRDAQRPVRLRKWVETQPVSEQADLRRETAHVEREQVNRPAPGAEFGDEEVETTLHDEEPVIEKETVERERVRLAREERERHETVHGEVRREHVEAEGEFEAEDEGRRDDIRRAG
ncbi:MAG: PRC and DUF2382 domain-containing protein [Dehalococcoidia bacterium]